MKGKCSFKRCKAEIQGTAINNKTLYVEVKNFDKNIVHVGTKRRITGTSKENMEKKLQNSTAAKVRSDLAGQLMKPGDVEPSQLPKLSAIRKQKSRMSLKKAESSNVMQNAK